MVDWTAFITHMGIIRVVNLYIIRLSIFSFSSLFYRRLKNLRLEKELSQEAVAFEVEISRDHLSNIENGKHSINIKTLYKLAEFFKVDMKYFF